MKTRGILITNETYNRPYAEAFFSWRGTGGRRGREVWEGNTKCCEVDHEKEGEIRPHFD